MDLCCPDEADHTCQPSGSHQTLTGDPRYIWKPTEAERLLAPRYDSFGCIQHVLRWPSLEETVQAKSPAASSTSPQQQLSSPTFTENFDADLQEYAYDQQSQFSFFDDYDVSLANTNNNIDMEMMKIDSVMDPSPSTCQPFSLPATSCISSGEHLSISDDLSTSKSFSTTTVQTTSPHASEFPPIRSPILGSVSSSTSTSPSTILGSSPQTNSSSQISCTFNGCERTFSHKHELNRHLKSHTHPCHCQHCGRGFETPKDVRRHINDVHQTTRRFFCTVASCRYSRFGADGKGFSRKENWKRHMRNKHGDLRETETL